MLFIGIDLGTSACKLLLVGENGTIQNEVTREYPLIFPHPGWSEQRPEDWWNAVVAGVPELLRGFDASQVVGIGAGGQMHGLVALDAQDSVIRPAILWNDGRTFKEVDYLNNTIGKERLSALTANIAFAGFTAPKLLWMRENEPENFKKIAKIMLPKDYVNYKLTVCIAAITPTPPACFCWMLHTSAGRRKCWTSAAFRNARCRSCLKASRSLAR